MLIYRSFITATALIISIVGLTACSFSNSSGSASESSNSFSTSSESISDSVSSITSSPSKSSKEGSPYQDDVKDFTVAYVKSTNPNANIATFQKELSNIAANEGVLNWEQDERTYIGIGRGLNKANLSEMTYETFKKNFAEGDYQKMKDIQKGFDME